MWLSPPQRQIWTTRRALGVKCGVSRASAGTASARTFGGELISREERAVAVSEEDAKLRTRRRVNGESAMLFCGFGIGMDSAIPEGELDSSRGAWFGSAVWGVSIKESGN